jgi:predicted component of type VI protein secretion system
MSVVLRLFEADEPGIEVEARVLAGGELMVGRDSGADWPIRDPSRTLSRRHCRFALDAGALTVRDDSTNGVSWLGGDRLPPGEPVAIGPGEAVRLGAYLIRVDAPAGPRLAPVHTSTLPALSDDTPAGRLVDAFCQGAQIDPSVLCAEDPMEIMRRLGAVYREMMLGLGRLVNDRTRAKAEHGLEWTAVQALDNNPFRWAPPQRVAVELLQSRQEGFLGADAAVRASFEDVSDHQARMAAGARAALGALLAELSPDAVAEGLQGQSLFMKNRAEALWSEYKRLHAKAAAEPGAAAFREGYAASEPASPETSGRA